MTTSDPEIVAQTFDDEPEAPPTKRCPAKRLVKQVGYGEADVHCQRAIPEVDDDHFGRHEMVTEADGVQITYRWR